MSDNPTPGAVDVIRSALTAAGFQDAEATALVEQAIAARAPAPPPRAPISTPAGAAAAKTYSIDELRTIASTLGLGGAAAPAPAPPGPPITSRGTPPPAGKPTADTPILSMSEADRRALAAEIGDIKFADRMIKEMVRDNVRVRSR